MPKPRIISAGNFSRGMMPDQIGARDSAAMIMDGVVDRAGEVRLRGAKTAYGNLAASHADDRPFGGATIPLSHLIGNGGSAARKSLHAFGSADATAAAGETSIFLNAGTSTYTKYTATDADLSDTTKFAWSMSSVRCVASYGSELVFCMSNGSQGMMKWAGSTKAAYTTGTVSTTAGSKTITGNGTSWSANVEGGQYLWIDDAGTDLDGRCLRIVDVLSDTSLEVEHAPSDSVSTKGYNIISVGQLSEGPSLTVFQSLGRSVGAKVACSHQGRLWVGDTFDVEYGETFTNGSRVRWSALPSESSGNFNGMDYWQANAYADIAPGVGGDITGLASVGSSLVILKAGAVCVLSGDVAADGTDLGARVDVVASDCGCPSVGAFEVSKIGLVWANRSGVWLMDGGYPTNLCDGRILSVYRDKAAAANTADFSVSAVGDRIIVQLAAGENTFVFDTSKSQWTMQDCALYSKILEVRGTDGDLVGEIGGQLVSTTAYFDKWDTDLSASGGTDSQSSTTPALKLVTQPLELSDGGLPVGRPSAVYVDGFIRDAGTSDPYIAVSLLYGASGADTGEEAAVALAKTITEGTYEAVHRIPVDAGDAKRRRQVRVVLESEVGSGECKIYGVWLAATAAESVGP